MRLDRALSSTASAPVSTGGCFGCASKLPAIRHDVDALMVHGHGMMMVMMREPPRARAISTINQHPPVSPALLKANATFTRRRRQQDADGCEPCGRWLDTLSRQHRQLSARLAHSEELPFLRCERPSWNAASPRLTAPTEPFNLSIPRQHKDWKTKARQYVAP